MRSIINQCSLVPAKKELVRALAEKVKALIVIERNDLREREIEEAMKPGLFSRAKTRNEAIETLRDDQELFGFNVWEAHRADELQRCFELIDACALCHGDIIYLSSEDAHLINATS